VIVAVVVGLASLKPKTTPTSVNRPPVAHFAYEADNLTVEFNASASDDPDGNITSYSWTFGDETNGTGEVAEHTYPANGTYEVVLTVTDNGGEKNSTSTNITVKKKVPQPPPVVKKYPVALIEIDDKDNLTVVVSGIHSTAPESRTIVNYSWDFGDGLNASAANVTHTYAANGTYTITLTVKDSEGMINSTTLSVTVKKQVTPPPPHELGPPGLLHAIEIHEQKADRNSGLQNSLDHLRQNLDRWLSSHSTVT